MYMPDMDYSNQRLVRIGEGFGMAFEKIIRMFLNRLHDEVVELQSHHPDADPVATFRILHKIVSNLIANPKEMKFRKLKKSNEKVNKHLLRYQAALDLLSVIGFEVQFDSASDVKMESEEIDTRDGVWVFTPELTLSSKRLQLLDAAQIQSETVLKNLKRKRQQPAEVILEAIRRAPAGLRFHLQASSEEQLPDTRQFMGIKNIGAVCYLNSMMQVLFFNSVFRRLIFSVERPEDGDVDQVKDDAKFIIYTLQEFFYAMFTRRRTMSVDPTMLLKAFGWDDEERYLQRDVNEFQMNFLDKIEEGLKGLDAFDEFRSSFYGREAVRNFSVEVGYESRRAEPFSLLTLQLSGVTQLEEALAGYIQGTTNVEIDVDGHGRTDCKQQWELEEIPPILHFHLQRFTFSETWQSIMKKHDRLEFPLAFDMAPYVIVQDESDMERSLEYELYAVLVHRGTTNAGHYWAYVRCCVVENGCEREAWYCMNDTQVEETTWETVQKYAFGQENDGDEDGGENDGVKNVTDIDADQALRQQWSAIFGSSEYESFMHSANPSKFASAYMLIYVAKEARDRILCPLESDYTLPSFHNLQSAIAKSESLRMSKYQEGKLINDELVRRGLQPKQLCLCGKCLQKRKAQFT